MLCQSCHSVLPDDNAICPNCPPEVRPLASGGDRKCPYCAETIKAEAIKCRHCGEMLNENEKMKGDIENGMVQTAPAGAVAPTYEPQALRGPEPELVDHSGMIAKIVLVLLTSIGVLAMFGGLGVFSHPVAQQSAPIPASTPAATVPAADTQKPTPNSSDGSTQPSRAVDDVVLRELPDTKQLKSALLKHESFSDDPVENATLAGVEAARLMRKMQGVADRLHISSHAVQVEFSELLKFGERSLVESNDDMLSQLETAMMVNSGLTPEQGRAKRKQVAANFDQYFLDHNRESSTSAYGQGGTCLKITDPLAGRVRENQMIHTLPFIDLKEAGFKRITYTNGYNFSSEWVLTRR